MSEQFLEWFDKTFSEALFKGEEREYLKTYTWFAWRDALRQNTTLVVDVPVKLA